MIGPKCFITNHKYNQVLFARMGINTIDSIDLNIEQFENIYITVELPF